MPPTQAQPIRRALIALSIMLLVLAVVALLLRTQGRAWICSCGRVLLWAGDVCSSDNSQHFFDPYSFTHILHGFMFAGALALLVPRLAASRQFVLAVVAEAVWEIVENSEFVIERYRQATAALGYHGDTVVNSWGDIICCAVGFMIARRLGLRWSLLIFALTEVALTIWIRDSLILEILMLIYPIDAIKAWQTCP
jgi:Protein of unknown function (DUF2585)